MIVIINCYLFTYVFLYHLFCSFKYHYYFLFICIVHLYVIIIVIKELVFAVTPYENLFWIDVFSEAVIQSSNSHETARFQTEDGVSNISSYYRFQTEDGVSNISSYYSLRLYFCLREIRLESDKIFYCFTF